MDKPILALVAVAALVAAVVWGRSAQRLQRVWLRIEDELGAEADATVLARSGYRKELHTVTLYAVIAVASALAAACGPRAADYFFAFVLLPAGLSVLFGRPFRRAARLAADHSLLQPQADDVLPPEVLDPP